MAIGDGNINGERTLILVGIEATPGTPESLVGANAVLVENFSAPEYEAEIIERPVSDTTGVGAPHLMGKRMVKISFRVPFAGSGAAGTPSDISPLLEMCGMKKTVSSGVSVGHSPDETDNKNGTLFAYVGGKWLFKTTGAVGNMKLSMKAGEPAYLDFELTGLYVAPSAADFPGSITVDSNEPPVFLGSSFTFGGSTLAVRELSVDLGAQIQLRPVGVNTGVGGYLPPNIMGFKPTGSIQTELDDVADDTIIADALAQTDYVIDATLGGTAGNILDIDLAAVRCEMPKIGKDGLLAIVDRPFRPYNDSGNDFFVLTEK